MHALDSAPRYRGGSLQAGLKHDPNSEELKEGIRRTLEAMSKVCFVHDHTLHTRQASLGPSALKYAPGCADRNVCWSACWRQC